MLWHKTVISFLMYIVWFQKISIPPPQKDLPYDPAPSPPDFPKTAPKIYPPLLRNFQNFHTPPGSIAISHWSEQRGNFLFTTMPNFVSFMYFLLNFSTNKWIPYLLKSWRNCSKSSHANEMQGHMGNITVLFSHCVKKKAKCMNEYKQKIVMQSLTCWKRLVYLLCYIEK